MIPVFAKGTFVYKNVFKVFRHGESLNRHFVFLIEHLYTHKCKRERERERD